MVTKYQKRISGPLLDRIDIHIEVPAMDYEKLSGDRLGESSESISQFVRVCKRRVIFRRNASPPMGHQILSAKPICACGADTAVLPVAGLP